ncbi:MAG TPA: hypothetical protein VM165_21120 [Planctomycetaceae bacterium]|nr:hypothetical protein [Planctomycetaceae bacterium]
MSRRGMEYGLAALAIAWLLCGCGQASRPAGVADRAPVAPTASVIETVSAESDGAAPPAAAEVSRIAPQVREEIDLFAFSTLQIQRVTLLQESGVHQDLKLTEAQIASFAKLGQEVKQMSSTLQTLSGDQRREKLMNDYRPKAAEYEKLVDAALDAPQERRLLQKVLQRQRGAIIFLLPGVPDELDLTVEQRDFLYELIETTRQSVNLDNLNSPIELGRIFMKANAARKKAEEQLTTEQRAAWEKLLGN